MPDPLTLMVPVYTPESGQCRNALLT